MRQREVPALRTGKRLIRLLGWIVALLALLWVLRPLVRDYSLLRAEISTRRALIALPLAALGYSLCTLLLATAWHGLLRLYRAEISWRRAWRVWAISQWAKYLPTNTLHLVGRQVLGRQAGVAHGTLITSAVLELATQVTAAATIFSLLSGREPLAANMPSVLRTLETTRWVLPMTALLWLGLLLWPTLEPAMRRLPAIGALLRELPPLRPWATRGRIVGCVLIQCIFFLAVGLLLRWLSITTLGWQPGPAAAAVWAFPVAWLVGTMTPGAPAGTGVREAMIVLLLGPLAGNPQAAILALLARAMTLTGDALTALLGWLTPVERSSQPEPENLSKTRGETGMTT